MRGEKLNRVPMPLYLPIPNMGQVVNIKDKDSGVRQYVSYNLNRTQAMTKWDGLPETVKQRELELTLQTKGYACIAEVTPKKNLPKGIYLLKEGGLGGERNADYIPTKFVGANPYMDIDYELEIGKECVIIRNDTLMYGLLPLLNRAATMMVENDITMLLQSINTRMLAMITANTDREKQAADLFIKKIIDGELSAVVQNPMFGGIQAQPLSNQDISTNNIEYQQYLKASLFNELGIDANYNMKRESLNMVESQMNDDALAPFVDDMLNNRKIGCEELNSLYGLNVSVDLSSSWKTKMIEREMVENGDMTTSSSQSDGGENDADEKAE